MNPMRMRSRLVQVVLTNLGLCALALSQAKPSGPPTLSGFSPTQGAAGSTVTITFTGTNFVARGARLILTPNQGVTIGNALVASSGQISVMVQIDAGAQPGNRQVLLMDADHSLISPTPFTITAGQQPCSANGLAAAAACGPALRGFTPLQGTQGSTVTLTFTGTNFAAPASLQFTPSAGLTVQSAAVTNSNQVQAQVSIAPNAALGSRGVVLTTGKTKQPASNTFTVVSSTKVELPPMQILRVVPNQIAAGSQNVDLTLQGTNFVPGIQVTFTVGAGVPAAVFAAGPARYINSTEIHVTVNALPAALPGGRDVVLQTPNQQTMVGKGMLNVQAVKQSGPPTVLKIAPITLQNFPQGVITLTAPTNPVQGSDGYGAGYVIPMLDDSAAFQWQEKNPGLANYYVLRIYAKDGKTLLASQKITGPMVTIPVLGTLDLVPTYFRPDSAFLKQVLSNPAVRMSNGASVTPQFDPAKLVGSADMQWEVAGFHTYNKNGVAPQQNAGGQNANAMHMQMIQGAAQGTQTAQAQSQGAASNAGGSASGGASSGGTVDVQVEISNRWPLDATRAPTGLACNGGMTGTGLQINDVDGTLPNGAKDPNSYIGDRFVLSGSFSVAGSPYASRQTFAKAQTTPPSLAPPITQVQFNNVFVDWGDGTVQAVSAPPSDANDPNKNYNWDPTQSVTLPQSTTDPNALIHKYQATGGFTIRLFQLSEADLQHVNIASVSASVDGPTTTFTQTALLSKMAAQGTLNGGKFTLTSLQSGMQAVFSGEGSGPPLSPGAQVASDAYMLFCAPATITVPEDLAADGPLHLKGIDNPDFNSYDLPKIKQIGLPGLERGPLGQQGGKPAVQSDVHAVEIAGNATAPQAGKAPEMQKAAVGLGKTPGLPGQPQLTPIAVCSECDDGLDATTYLHYYGQGQVQMTWLVDGVIVKQTPLAVPHSTQRKNLTRQGFTTIQIGGFIIPIPIPEPPIIVTQSAPIDSPPLGVTALGNHAVVVQAQVMPQPTAPNLSSIVDHALHSLVPVNFGAAGGSGSSGGSSGSGKQATGPDLSEAQALLSTLAAPAGSNLPPLKVGLLSPSNHNSGGLGAVQYINSSLQAIISQLPPDQYVASNPSAYQVVASDPKKPCKFLFPVQSGGAFEISGLQNSVTHQGSTYNGTGKLIIHMANVQSASNGQTGYDQYPAIPISINNWTVPDGLTVTSGSFDVSPAMALAASLPALTGTIDKLHGQVGNGTGVVNATLSVTLSDNTLRLPGESPVGWSAVTAELHSTGDWIAKNLSMPLTLIGWSGFTMQSNNVTLDLSHHDGDAAGLLCGNLKAGDWVGVRFPTLTVNPYTMNLVSASSMQQVVTDWGITSGTGSSGGAGLCGAFTTGPFHATVGAGTVSFKSVHAQAFNGNFSATYNSMDIHVPFLNTDLIGNASLQSGGGQQAMLTFPCSTVPNPCQTVTQTFNDIKITAKNLQFLDSPLGWGVQADTHFAFSAENKPFAAFDHPYFFGMDGRGYFPNGAQAVSLSLGGSSTLGQTPLDLLSVRLTAPVHGAQVLAAQFSTNLHISEALPAAAVQVNYELDEPGSTYIGNGPTHNPFTIDFPFPAGQPSSEAKIHPLYSGANDTEYSGKVDLSVVGGPPVTGEFRLGYFPNGGDYWLTRVSIPLGPTGIVVIPVPPVMNMYRIQGGVGHNFPISAFQDTGSLASEQPVQDGSVLVNAGVRVGMPDQFTYTVDGGLTIKSGGQDSGARIDFSAWLLKNPPDSGDGDFHGVLQFAGGNFDGQLWGGLNFMNGIASMSLGTQAAPAVTMHFGPSAPWHIYAGQQGGPRIQGHLLISDASMYVMLSDAGLSLGGSEGINLTVGSSGVASAWVNDTVDMGLTVTPQPHIAGTFSANVNAGVCVNTGIAGNACISAGVSAQIQASAMPVEIEASASISVPVVGSISFSVSL
jgi:hypothetical protein